MFNDLHVECKIERLENGINVWHFVSKKEGEGNAKEALKRVVEIAKKENYEYVVVNMGNKGQKDSAEFLSNLGFNIIESEPDHVTGEIEVEESDKLIEI